VIVNREETKTLLKKIDSLYPNKLKMADPSFVIDAWQNVLKKYPAEMVENKLLQHIQNSSFCPSVADLIPKEEYERHIKKQETEKYLNDVNSVEGVKGLPPEIKKQFKDLLDKME
jgi:hypothetical protein